MIFILFLSLSQNRAYKPRTWLLLNLIQHSIIVLMQCVGSYLLTPLQWRT